MEKPDNQSKQQNSDPVEKVRDTIMQLSDLCDLIGLRTYIVKRTKHGKRPGATAWMHTRAALATYAPTSDPDRVIQLFESVGCKNEIDAVRWLLKHDELVP